MPNERKTERIVFSHFNKSSDIIHIEEQSTDIFKIDKLLKNASKKGIGKGRPEFIITFKKNDDLLVVVECKADITKHESPTKDKYADYAVDGVLLYASFLSKEYDVLAIAVSGETEEKLKVSHFLHLKGERKAVEIFGNKLLPVQSYLSGYLKSPEKFRQDYNTLLAFTKTLNEKLHSYKILESQRSLLLSCILIALEDDAFRASYDKKTSPKSLADSLIKTVSEKLEEANITGKRLENLTTQFSFIKTDTSLSTKEKILKELIDEVDENINRFIKTHEYFDILGQLYIEFLRYANSDKGLGIVLTPPHITELFAKLAQVNKSSIIYDNCAGTGGFLISAMKEMIKDAKGDEEKIKQIKSKQLISVEYQSHIFALAVSNMYIHQDGKTNIINGSCFDEVIMKQVKAQKPTIGFLNPPYQGNRKTDTDELEFILNNLECLVDGGTCIAIVPMQKALATKGEILELKKKLLERHTLEAVLSMPDELFFNSDVNVVTCIMIFTAHRKHSSTKKTYFGYYKNDGFVKRKVEGRFDGLGKWEGIKKKWITYYLDENRREEVGFSINRIITHRDEWCAEAYMDTDYSKLTKRDFEDTILSYVTFLISERLSKQVLFPPLLNKEIAFYTNNWLPFKLKNLFEITGSQTTSLSELEEYGKGKYPYVTTQATNNGVEKLYDFYTEEGNVLTIDSAVLGYCSYQALRFSASDHVEKLIPKFTMNKYVAMFFVTIFKLEQYRYNYGRKASQDRLKQSSIKLPVNEQGSPDWKYMEDYIKSLPYSSNI
jgi:type I restriction-modification system DNA methylase subunit